MPTSQPRCAETLPRECGRQRTGVILARCIEVAATIARSRSRTSGWRSKVLPPDLAVQAGVAGFVDLAHPARANGREDLVRAEGGAGVEGHQFVGTRRLSSSHSTRVYFSIVVTPFALVTLVSSLLEVRVTTSRSRGWFSGSIALGIVATIRLYRSVEPSSS